LSGARSLFPRAALEANSDEVVEQSPVRLSSTFSRRRSKQVACDNELLNLARTIENAKCPGVPVKPFDGSTLHHTSPAEDLSRFIYDRAGSLGCLPLRNSCDSSDLQSPRSLTAVAFFRFLSLPRLQPSLRPKPVGWRRPTNLGAAGS